jgi:tetratricopeptide (TPR) repeat protein
MRSGEAAFQSGDLAGALALFRSAAKLFAAEGNIFGDAVATMNIGVAAAKLKQYDAAVAAFMQAIRMFSEMKPDSRDVNLRLGITAFSLGTTLCEMGRLFRGSSLLEFASPILRAVGQAEMANQAASQHAALLNHLPKGLSNDQQENYDEWRAQFVTNNGAGIACRDRGDHASAVRHFRTALEAARELKRDELSASVLETIGLSLFRLGQADEAMESLREAASVAARCGARQIEASSLASLANGKMIGGDLYGAIDTFQQALTIKRTLPDRSSLAQTLSDIGIAYARSKQQAAAVEAMSSAIEIFAATGNRSMHNHIQDLRTRVQRGDDLNAL